VARRGTVEYLLLRGIGHLDVFPDDDVGARYNLVHFLGRRPAPAPQFDTGDHTRRSRDESRWSLNLPEQKAGNDASSQIEGNVHVHASVE
jgi:hypothetical protein